MEQLGVRAEDLHPAVRGVTVTTGPLVRDGVDADRLHLQEAATGAVGHDGDVRAPRSLDLVGDLGASEDGLSRATLDESHPGLGQVSVVTVSTGHCSPSFVSACSFLEPGNGHILSSPIGKSFGAASVCMNAYTRTLWAVGYASSLRKIPYT